MTVAALLATVSGSLRAQTITGSVATQPCNNNGQINVSTTGFTPPISYTYTNWMANLNITHSSVGTSTDNLSGIGAYQGSWFSANDWFVIASDGVHTATTMVSLAPVLSFSCNVNIASCPASSTVSALVSGGTAPYSYLWTNQNSLLTYSTNPAAVSNGPYGLTVTDANGCTISSIADSSNIYVSSNAGFTVAVSGSSANCTNGTASATAVGGVAPYTYQWNNGAVTQNISGLTSNYYMCTVTDAQGCQSTNGYYVWQAITLNINATVNNATCLMNNGAITSFVNGGTAPYSFLWSNGATTQNISGLTGGSYQVHITDANGCVGSYYSYVSISTTVNVNYTTSASSCTTANGSATLNVTSGTAPYSYIWYTSPVATTSVISGMPSGTYAFKVTDANGCIRTGSAFIPPVSSIYASLSANNVVCPATTGNIHSSVSGSHPPFTYAWSNSATTSSLSGVPLGAYSCVITDAVGCSVTKSASLLQTSPMSLGFGVTPASCIYNADGTASVTVYGGTSPFAYHWSNGQTTSAASGLNTGYVYLNVTDANGCHASQQTFVAYNATNTSCYCTITGTVYVDANNNCSQDAGEAGVPNIQMHCSGLGYAYTNASGVYSFMAPTGNYTVTESIQQIYPLASCQSNNQVVSVTAGSGCTSTLSFANNVVVIHDLHIITTAYAPPVPGNVYNQQVIVQNDGSAVESGIQLGYTHDGQLAYSSCIPWALTQQNPGTYPDWYSITSGFPTLNPGFASGAFISYNVPANIPLNTQVSFYDTAAYSSPIAASWLADNTPWNNVNQFQTTVVGSFDPNFKEVTPKGVGPQGFIQASDSMLTYVVHFQNTGSYYAQNIVVVDTLDSDLQLTSLRPGYSNYNYRVAMSDNGVMKFTFNNINLPWQAAYGDMASSGLFTYSVKLRHNLTPGTQIKNKAAIYFDYNAPVITNTTLNTLAPLSVSVREISAGIDNALLFPNPAGNYFTLTVNSRRADNGILRIYDISGREVLSRAVELQAGENNLQEATTLLQNGIYLVQLKTANLQVGKKLVITK